MEFNFIDKVYETIQSTSLNDVFIPEITPSFVEGEICLRLYEKVYDAKWRICDEHYCGREAEDVEIIISRMFDIMQEVGYRMYLCGAKYGIPEGTDTRTPAERLAAEGRPIV